MESPSVFVQYHELTFLSLETEAVVRDEKDDRLLLRLLRRQNRLTGEEQKSSLGSGKKQESSRDKSEIPCRFKFCKIRHVDSGILLCV